MKIKQLSYKDYNWELDNLKLSNVNLLVGKNGTGKTRTLQTIDLLVKMITQRRDLNWGAEWEVVFENYKQQELTYKFSTSSKRRGVTFEELSIDGSRQVMYRSRKNNGGAAQIADYTTDSFDTVYPPDNKLLLHTNRDVKAYPYLEDIANWAEQSYGFKFGNISPYAKLNRQEYDLLTAVEDIPTLYQSLKPADKEKVIRDFNGLGYHVTGITIQGSGATTLMMVKEAGVHKKLPHFQLSQGMFRSLALLVYVQYLTSRKRPATIIIDDLCEGLDYDRATKLGRLIFNNALEGDIQLIATSNDNFLMEVVDLNYLNVLYREGKTVRGINADSHPQLFEDFKFTGLSNFDFFASDFLKAEQG